MQSPLRGHGCLPKNSKYSLATPVCRQAARGGNWSWHRGLGWPTLFLDGWCAIVERRRTSYHTRRGSSTMREAIYQGRFARCQNVQNCTGNNSPFGIERRELGYRCEIHENPSQRRPAILQTELSEKRRVTSRWRGRRAARSAAATKKLHGSLADAPLEPTFAVEDAQLLACVDVTGCVIALAHGGHWTQCV